MLILLFSKLNQTDRRLLLNLELKTKKEVRKNWYSCFHIRIGFYPRIFIHNNPRIYLRISYSFFDPIFNIYKTAYSKIEGLIQILVVINN